MAWLTPNSVSGVSQLLLTLPSDPLARIAATGALLDLAYERNWKSFGASTPYDTAKAFFTYWKEIQWNPLVGALPVKFSHVKISEQQDLDADTWALLALDTVVSDAGEFDPESNSWVSTGDGYYNLNLVGTLAPPGSGQAVYSFAVTINSGFHADIAYALVPYPLYTFVEGSLSFPISDGQSFQVYVKCSIATSLYAGFSTDLQARVLKFT